MTAREIEHTLDPARVYVIRLDANQNIIPLNIICVSSKFYLSVFNTVKMYSKPRNVK